MSLENEHRLRFRDAMASLSAAVNIVTTDGHGGCCG
ncbi:4-hydroxyphenylacetate 3-monooxygenase, partial [Enterobacter hormaechei]|nr:4-hydroxyphenylacetate 3-monooxygenase [Enterobacter hormaechei]